MNLARFALRYPWTIVVAVVAVGLGAWLALQRMTRDIFPPLGIPTIMWRSRMAAWIRCRWKGT
jgi:hypothetical protein